MWATGDLVSDREGTLIRVVEWLPARHVVLPFIAASFFLSLWIIPDIQAIVAGTAVPFVPWFAVLGTFAVVVMSLGNTYKQVRKDRANLRKVLESALAGPPVVPDEPWVGSQRSQARRARWIQAALVLLVLGLFGLFIVVANVTGDPPAARMQSVVQAEFDRIPPVPGAVTVDAHVTHKPGSALADATYRTTDDYRTIRAHYDAALAAQGWSSRAEEPLTDWGRDLGGWSEHYCQTDLEADLDYAGERASYGWTYAFSVAWRANSMVCRQAP